MENSENRRDATLNCRQHGSYAGTVTALDGIEFPSRCPRCEAEEAENAEQQQRLRLAELRRESGIPTRYADVSFDTFRVEHAGQQRALEQAKALVAAVLKDPHTAPNVIFAGGPGTGKTHLSCAIVRELIPHRQVRRRKVMDLIRILRETWRRDSERTTREVVHFYASLPLLIIEEVGTTYGAESERVDIFDIMDARYENQLPTLLITNLDAEELTKEIGERVVDRLRDGDRVMVPFNWQSRRGAE